MVEASAGGGEDMGRSPLRSFRKDFLPLLNYWSRPGQGWLALLGTVVVMLPTGEDEPAIFGQRIKYSAGGARAGGWPRRSLAGRKSFLTGFAPRDMVRKTSYLSRCPCQGENREVRKVKEIFRRGGAVPPL